MSKTFKFEKDLYGDWNLYQKDSIEIKEGYTALVGCNGIGKTTFIDHIILSQLKEEKYVPAHKLNYEEDLKDGKKVFIQYSNLIDGGSNSKGKAAFQGNMNLFANLFLGSEGENISTNVGGVAQTIGMTIRNHKEHIKELWVLLDGIDSGLSIDSLEEVRKFFDLLLEDNKSIPIYIICAVNNYELVKDNKQNLDLFNMNYIEFKDYNDYRNFILESAKNKENRYNKKGK